MQRVGHVWRVKPGCVKAYHDRHAVVSPELEALLREAGVRSYTIYRWGEVLFSHIEVEDFDRLVGRLDGDPIVERWAAAFSDILEYPNPDPDTGWPERLAEVWSLDGLHG